MGVGKHLLVDLYGIADDRIRNCELIKSCLQLAADRAGLTPLAPAVVHCFKGGGLTGFILLSESHIALHTYPEHAYIALDIFSCGPSNPHDALEAFRDELQPSRVSITETVRGEFS